MWCLRQNRKDRSDKCFSVDPKKKKVLEGNIPKLYVSVWREKTL